MKNFDLNACGVQEMNAAEVVEVNGGGGGWGDLGFYLFEQYCDNVGTIIGDYMALAAKGTYSHPGASWGRR